MKNTLQTVFVFALFYLSSSFAQEMNANDCDIHLIKNTLSNKLDNIYDYKTDIFVSFEGLKVKSNIAGKKPGKMKIHQIIKTPEYKLIHTAVFDGKYQWVESKRDTFTQVVKLKISSLANQQRPFDTGYYLMGTGLLNGEDYVSTFTNLLRFYNLVPACKNNTITLSGIINKKIFKHYALNTKTNKSSNETVNKYFEKFSNITIQIDKKSMTINNYKLGSDNQSYNFEALFENTEINRDIEDALFVYFPPAGIKVVDITNDVINNK